MSKTTADGNEPGRPPRRFSLKGLLSVVRLVAINLVVFAVLVELVSIVFVNRKSWPAGKPTYHPNFSQFWADINPAFGVWHWPNHHFLHQEGCFSVEYTSNSYGARDKERSLHASAPRTIMLGDSFIEGWGLPTKDRLSDIMEHDTGREFLNFATSGNFGPLQYALVYKTMAAKFDHTAVVVGVLPDNDFLDMNYDYYKSTGQGDRYRPYYAPDFSIVYSGHFTTPKESQSTSDDIWEILRAYLASYHVARYIYAASGLYWHTRGIYSGFNDYTDVDLERLKVALRDIKATADAHHAKTFVILIPRANDFIRLHQTGADRLGPVMVQWGKDNGISIMDLLPQMNADAGGSYMPYFQSCDGHWSARGTREAATILEPWLGGQGAKTVATAPN